ncbi:hypothetical protein F4824DRAFT_306560 [Ustulina deusta]|nr:hypothetical protein F4824DRAFT_306560 [Ustulina deusta]
MHILDTRNRHFIIPPALIDATLSEPEPWSVPAPYTHGIWPDWSLVAFGGTLGREMGYCGAVKTCLFSSPAEAPSPTRVRRLPDDRAPGLVACCIASIVFSTVAVVLRLWSRGVIVSLAFWCDDAAILVTLVFSYALLGITLYWTSIGLGQHSLSRGARAVDFVFIINLINRVNLVFYSACVLLVKISALLLYARIFKASPACFVDYWHRLDSMVGHSYHRPLAVLPPYREKP